MTLAMTWAARGDSRSVALRGALIALAGASLAACAGGPRPDLSAVNAGGAPTPRYTGYKVGRPYQVKGVWYYPKDEPNYDEIGIASWYGEQFHNHYTADGEVFDMQLPSAAHKTLPLPSLVEVTNLANGRTLMVRVNDRGPFVDGRVIDLSRAAAAELGFVATGVTRVRVRYVGRADDPPEPRQDLASRLPKPQLKAPSLKPPSIQMSPPPVEMANAVITPPAPPMGIPLLPPNGEAAIASAVLPAAAPVALSALTAPGPAPVTQASLAPVTAVGPPSYVAPTAAPAPTLAAAASAALPAAATAAATAGRLSDVEALLASAGPASSAASAAAGAAPQATAAAPTPGLQVQAGVFSNQANAARLAARLSESGTTTVEPFARNGQTLYRVVVRGVSNPAQAAAIRTQAASFGAPDARIISGL